MTPANTKTTVKTIPIANITIPKHRIRTTSHDVSELAASINATGLANPITVDQDHVLVAGLHRLRACESLGWKTIPAKVQRFDTQGDRDLVEIDENLVRHDLTVLERAEHLHRKVEILREKGVLAPAHRPKKGAAAASFRVTMDDLAGEFKMGKRTLQEYLRLAKKIKPGLRRALHKTKLANDRGWLARMAGLGTYTQNIAQTFLRATDMLEVAGGGGQSTRWLVEHLVPVMMPPDPYSQILSDDELRVWEGHSRAYRTPLRVVSIYPGEPLLGLPTCWIHCFGREQNSGSAGPVWRLFAHGWLQHHLRIGLDDFCWDARPCAVPLRTPPSEDLPDSQCEWTERANEQCRVGKWSDRQATMGDAVEDAPMLWEDLLWWGLTSDQGATPDLSTVSDDALKTPVREMSAA